MLYLRPNRKLRVIRGCEHDHTGLRTAGERVVPLLLVREPALALATLEAGEEETSDLIDLGAFLDRQGVPEPDDPTPAA